MRASKYLPPSSLRISLLLCDRLVWRRSVSNNLGGQQQRTSCPASNQHRHRFYLWQLGWYPRYLAARLLISRSKLHKGYVDIHYHVCGLGRALHSELVLSSAAEPHERREETYFCQGRWIWKFGRSQCMVCVQSIGFIPGCHTVEFRIQKLLVGIMKQWEKYLHSIVRIRGQKSFFNLG